MLEHLMRGAWLVLMATAACVAQAQTIPACENTAAHLSVSVPVNVSEDKVTTGSDVVVKVKSNARNRKISRVAFFLKGKSAVEIGAEQLRNIIDNPPTGEINDERNITLHTFVDINGKAAANLNLEPETDYDVVAFAFDDGVGPDQNCGHWEFKLHTGKLGPFAVIVGFNYTKQESLTLQWARDDAIAVAEHMIKRLQLKPQNIWLYTDDARLPKSLDGVVASEPVSPTQIIDKLAEIYSRADAGQTVFFYFSGHQYFLNKDRYMVMSQSDLENGRTMLSRKDLFETIASKEIKTVSILDACFSGSVTRAFETQTASPVKGRGAKIIGPPALGATPPLPVLKAYARLYSSHGDELSWEFPKINHGIFTNFLLEAAEKIPGDITLQRAFDYAYEATTGYKPTDPEIAKAFRQRPYSEGDSDTMRSPWVLGSPGAP